MDNEGQPVARDMTEDAVSVLERMDAPAHIIARAKTGYQAAERQRIQRTLEAEQTL